MSMMGTAVSGMLGDTNWLGTISQNVANANTTGYKNSETEFSALVDQAGANSPGGGVSTSVRSLNSLQGSVVGTSTTTDLAVQGDGYFVVSDSSGALYLTRNGSFVPDANGDLVNSAGYYLMGYNVQNGQGGGASNSLAGVQKVNVITSGEASTPTTTGTLAMNLPSTAAVVTNPADLPSANPAAAPASTSETSIVTYDNLGAAHTLNVYLTNTGPNAAGDPTWEATVYDSADAAAGGGFPYTTTPPNTPLATATLTFNPANGQMTSGSPLSIDIPNGQTMSLDLSSTTQLASSFSVNSAVANGNPPGSLTGVSISPNGTLDFQYSNGASNPGYDIPLATVASEDNLTSVTGDAFQANQISGSIRVGTAGSSGLGTIASSSLESSTVDLATELTQMIEAQSAYQANSKVFQTGADLLDILNNLKS
jgi:flagellar hook protein FlgE